ncbi:class I SAM-dependent methyltransferase [Fodinibius halophilus]|uniref:Methyltransferase domain-containing protein n=1 Tax=Fodinibius halophilus TaxID=1736908 RepID=A0A6M1T782_9BACT|nr:methyltransferase domain-containing protein [Fodinibius halophilus]NGP88513.1 methyltransferase domain-containing protein [Fodinibius halophilus]
MRPELQRRVQRYGWDYSSPHYEKGWDKQLWPAQQRLLENVNLQPGEDVLDVSCGTGLVTLPIAQKVGKRGKVMGIDLSEKMIEKAADKAEGADISNVSFERMDAEELDLADDRFDVAVNSLGMMYYPNPEKAIAEMYRVTKKEGRAAALVWGKRSSCGWAGIFPIVDRRVQTDVCPLFFSLGTGDRLKKHFKEVGFKQVRLERFNMTLPFHSDEEAIISAFLGGAVAMAYRKFEEEEKEEAHQEYLESIKPYWNGTAYEIPGEFVIVAGDK